MKEYNIGDEVKFDNGKYELHGVIVDKYNYKNKGLRYHIEYKGIYGTDGTDIIGVLKVDK